ncbi:nef attachable domain protein [Chlamydia psittaci C1/97]|nr:nef attachable domain protein [Chlamydia psittaci C1/97]
MCSVNSSHRVTAFPSRILSLRLFLWNLQSDIWKAVEIRLFCGICKVIFGSP